MEEKPVYYLDSNVFINSSINDLEIGNKCRSLLKEISSGKIIGITSCLSFDEIIWILRKIKPEGLIELSKSLLALNVKFVDVNKSILYKVVEIIEKYKLKPRDAIHLATMQINNCKTIITSDSDFNKISEIEKINPIDLEFLDDSENNNE